MNRRTICAVSLPVDVEHADGALVAHALLGYADDLRVILVECYTLDCRLELPCIQTFAGRDTP
jgi:hypothetical protein